LRAFLCCESFVAGTPAQLTTRHARCDPTYCGRVQRAPNGSIWLGDQGFIEDPILNTGSLQTRGVDAEINARVDVGPAGSLGLIGCAPAGRPRSIWTSR
jgi:hypothetical protein